MTYQGFEITKRFDFRTNKKRTSVLYGAGNSKTKGFFDNSKIAKLFIDWIVESDYSRNDKVHGPAFWKYYDATK